MWIHRLIRWHGGSFCSKLACAHGTVLSGKTSLTTAFSPPNLEGSPSAVVANVTPYSCPYQLVTCIKWVSCPLLAWPTASGLFVYIC